MGKQMIEALVILRSGSQNITNASQQLLFLNGIICCMSICPSEISIVLRISLKPICDFTLIDQWLQIWQSR